ncbi:hypothetical protein ATK78_0548 [Pedobacter metabolipauper]|uniref:Lipoprotein n=2 Tax=Pedobacter metabolipauper TaxID=425513 RepID=A0A4R6SYD8_9SPHI|nr:hypothetical protein ATK78_0548 [Pedobacter metabolipauper]
MLALFSCSKSVEQKLEDLEKEQLAFEKKIDGIKDTAIRNQAKQFGSMLFWFKKIDIENQKPPTDTSYEENPFVILGDYPTMSGLTNNFLNGILIENNGDMSTKNELKVHYPFTFPFEPKITWNTVQFNNNSNLPVKSEYLEGDQQIQVVKSEYNNDNNVSVYYPEKETLRTIEPTFLSGTIEATIPKAVLQFKFTNNETGDTKEQNGIKVKLVSIKDHMVTVDVTTAGPTDPSVDPDKIDLIKVMATDKTNKFLDHSGSSTGPEDLMDFFQDILEKIMDHPEDVKKLEKEMEKMQKEHEEKNKNQTHYRAFFRGSVEDVVVYIFDYSKATKLKKALKLPAYSFSNSSDGRPIANIATTTTVYDRSLDDLLKQKAELTQGELSKEIKIEQKPYSKPNKAGQYEEKAQFSFEYPKLLSTLFMDDFRRYESLTNVSFYEDKGGSKLINIPKDSIDYNNGEGYIENPWVEFQVNRVEYNPAKFPVKPKLARGVIKVMLADIKKTSYAVNKLPAGIKVSGNKLIIDGNLVNTNNSNFYVKDKTGKYLKQITTLTNTKGDGFDVDRTVVTYYYGVPHTIERLEQSDLRTVDHSFEIVLTEEVKQARD